MGRITQIIKEEIEQFGWDKNKVGDEPIQPNKNVFHVSKPEFRNNIANTGLEPRVGDSYSSWSGGVKAVPAVFATNGSILDVTGGLDLNTFDADIWVIDTTKINNEWFEDKHFSKLKDFGYNNPHIVTYNRISQNALSLVHRTSNKKK